MKKKLKIENSGTVSLLDDIGCGCGSCNNDKSTKEDFKPVHDHHHHHHDHDHPHDHHHEEKNNVSSLSVLDDIGCGCASCDIDHGHEGTVESNKEGTVILGSDSKLTAFLKKKYQLVLSFVLFFFALLTGFSKSVDLALFIVAYLLICRDVIKSAIRGIAKGQMLDENFLMSIASIVAFLIGEYAEGVAVMLFYAVGQLTEEYAINRSKGSISKLLDLRPDFANVKTLSGIQTVDPSRVKIGDILVIKPGEKVPLDGTVTVGTTLIDSAMLTGESLPVSIGVADEVYAGTINMNAVIEVKVTKSFSESAVSKILSMVQKANENKATTEKFITKFAKVYTPLVVLIAGLLTVLPPLVFGQSFETWAYRGAIFLVVSCPCALVISVPLGYFGGIGGAAKKGVLVKGGQYLEALKVAKTIVFDKTGTLTKGNFSVDHVDKIGDLSETQLLEISAHLESMSNHPIAKAIVSAYEGPIDDSRVKDVKEVAGKGITATFDGKRVMIGNDALMKDNNIVLKDHQSIGTTLYMSVDDSLEGILHISDEIKEKTLEGLKELKNLGVEKFIMLTGDRQPIAEAVGAELGIDTVHAELMPGDKLHILESLLNEKDKVVFVGDGINDAPVLTRADVGIAMGNLGSDVAVESSDVVLMNDEITAVADGIRVSRFTSKIIAQNIILALGVKVAIMILGTMGFASLWMAIFGDVGVAMLAILNSSRPVYQ